MKTAGQQFFFSTSTIRKIKGMAVGAKRRTSGGVEFIALLYAGAVCCIYLVRRSQSGCNPNPALCFYKAISFRSRKAFVRRACAATPSMMETSFFCSQPIKWFCVAEISKSLSLNGLVQDDFSMLLFIQSTPVFAKPLLAILCFRRHLIFPFKVA